jgi:hypothetical protein
MGLPLGAVYCRMHVCCVTRCFHTLQHLTLAKFLHFRSWPDSAITHLTDLASFILFWRLDLRVANSCVNMRKLSWAYSQNYAYNAQLGFTASCACSSARSSAVVGV